MNTTFDYNDFRVNSKNYTTRNGQKVRFVCETRGKMLVHVYSRLGSYMDADRKYNTNGMLYNSETIHDLVKVA